VQSWSPTAEFYPLFTWIRALGPAVLRIRIRDPVSFGPCIQNPDLGSGMENPWSGMRDEHPGSYFRELSNNFLGKKYLNSLSIQSSGAGIRCFFDLGSGIRDEKSGSGIRDQDKTSRIRISNTASPFRIRTNFSTFFVVVFHRLWKEVTQPFARKK
jgi:hypothetical protein